MSLKKIETFAMMLVGVLAIFAIKSIFEDDSSKIVSKEGRRILDDDVKMQEINQKIQESEGRNDHQEIII